LDISTVVKKLWKEAHSHLSSGFGVYARAGTSYIAPVAPRGPFGLAGPRTVAMRQRGIVADWHEWSKRKMYEGLHHRSHTMHNFSTSTMFVQIFIKVRKITPNIPMSSWMKREISLSREIVPEEKSAYSEIFFCGRSNS
jgi:hypothetical protein